MKTINIEFVEKMTELNELAKKISYRVSTGNEIDGFGMPTHQVEKFLKEHPEEKPTIDRLEILCKDLNRLV